MREWIVLSILVLGMPLSALGASSTPATVTKVIEGDLLEIERPGQPAETVRLYGIDTPEEAQEISGDAAAFSRAKVEGQEVSLELLATTTTGIPVVVIRTGAHENLNHELLKAGLAWWDQNNAPDDGTLKSINAKAIVAGEGIWADPATLAPRDFRKSHGLEPVVYQTEETDSAPEPESERPKVLKAKGDPNMKSGASPARPGGAPGSAAGGPPPRSGGAGANSFAGMEVPKNIDYMGLMSKHQPELTRDASGNVVGLTAKDIGSIPFASALGFQDGDVLTSVNGESLQSEGQIMGLVDKLKGQKNFEVGLMRNGSPTTITINVP